MGGLATAALAGGLAAVLVAAPTARVGGGPPADTASADVILLRAAKAAEAEPDLHPRRDQYLYIESKGVRSLVYAGHAPGRAVPQIRSFHRRIWLPVDPARAGLLQVSGEDPVWLCDGPQVEGAEPRPHQLPGFKVDLRRPPTDCDGAWTAYDPGLPTDAGRMHTWIYQHGVGENPPDVQAFTTVGDTISERYLGSKAMAAIFAAAARIPGVTVRKDVPDAAGRKGTAVGQTWKGLRKELIFDPKTYRLLGARTVVDDDDSFRPEGVESAQATANGSYMRMGESGPEKAPPGTVVGASAILRTAVTDEAGRPPRS